MARRIGYIRARYPETRNIIGRAAGDNEYVQIGKWHNRMLMLSRASEIIRGRIIRKQLTINWNHHAVYRTVGRTGVDVIHTFNAVCNTKTPWVSTFETAIPRTKQTVTRDWIYSPQTADKFTKKTFTLLAKDSCIGIIALSEANRKIQIDLMEAYDIADRDKIAEKITVLPPPQPRLISDDELEHKFDSADECVEFIFVGGDFFRKGGAQVVDALSRLIGKGRKFHLTVVSGLNYGDYASKTTAEDKQHYAEIIASADWITHYESLPNPQVLELCKKAHVGLLPTMADSYGYSVLEMQACGCPVITTDVRALPEMNNESCGYVFSVPKHSSGEAKFDTAADLEQLKNTIDSELERIFACILDRPEQLKTRGVAAAHKIEADHNPEDYARKLSEVYDRAAR